MNTRSSYALAVILSLAFHGALVAAITYGWEARQPERKPMPQFVQAKLVSVESLNPQKSAPPKVDVEQQRRQQAERERQRRAEEERRRAAERKKKEEADRKKAEEDRRKKEAEERARRERERQEQLEQDRRSALDEALQQEEELWDAARGSQAVASVAQAISERIRDAWSPPFSARNGMLAVVQINFVPTGRVVGEPHIVTSSGDPLVDRSVISAIKKVEVFPEVAELAREQPALFQREVRTTLLNFRVEGLRER